MVDLTNLRDRWSRLQQAQPRLRIRDAAAELGVTEAALVSSRTGDGVLRLRNEPAAIVEQLHRLGHTMALTRNEYAVSETFGPYSDVSINGHMGVVLDPAIDLRLFLNHWHHVWAVETESQGRRLRSFQFFDAYGDAVHKVYPKTDEGVEAFYALCEEFRHPEQEPVLTFAPRPVTPAEKPDSAVDVDAFQAGWRALEDTHHFYGLTRRHGVSRTQALRLAPPEMVTEVDVSAVTRMLKGAAEAAVPIMVFIGSRGCIQIFTGRVEQIRELDTWINVFDPGFHMHLDRAGLHRAWIVRKPTSDGIVTAVECFDSEGELVVQFFGERKPGKPELESWRALAESLAG